MEIRINVLADLPAFAALNRAWIEEYFEMEASDRKVLDRPTAIIEQGGFVLTLTEEGAVRGCCALLRNGARSFELAKMAVDPAAQGRGFGRALMRAAIALARREGAQRLDLLTSSKLAPALALYRKYGFKDLDRACHPDYARCDVIMQLTL